MVVAVVVTHWAHWSELNTSNSSVLVHVNYTSVKFIFKAKQSWNQKKTQIMINPEFYTWLMHSAEIHRTPSLLTVLCGRSRVRCLPGLSRRWARFSPQPGGTWCQLPPRPAPGASPVLCAFQTGLPASALQPAKVLVRAPRETATLTFEYVFSIISKGLE